MDGPIVLEIGKTFSGENFMQPIVFSRKISVYKMKFKQIFKRKFTEYVFKLLWVCNGNKWLVLLSHL